MPIESAAAVLAAPWARRLVIHPSWECPLTDEVKTAVLPPQFDCMTMTTRVPAV